RVRSRLGDSKSTIVRGSPARARSRSRRSPDRRGRNPSKTKRSVGSPEATSAAIAAEGPGTTRTSIPASTHARTSRYPGSESPGIPASEITATSSPERRTSRSSSVRLGSLPSNSDTIRARMPKCASSRPARRVSSAATSPTAASVSRARAVMSPRLPIGVPTRNRVPLTDRSWHEPGLRSPHLGGGTVTADGAERSTGNGAEPAAVAYHRPMQPVSTATEPAAPPPEPRGALATLRRWVNRPVVAVLAVGVIAGALRFAHLGYPSDRVFDEVYYSKSACIYLGYSNARCDITSSDEKFWRSDKNDTGAWVHPPL